MTDRWDDFDCALATSLTELPPPEETVQSVTPFRSAMGKVTAGLCLTCLSLEFWYLQYLLPALGAVLLALGFRSLRRNNGWFRACWVLSLCRAVLLYGADLLAATPVGDFSLPLWLRGLDALIEGGALLLCLWLGLVQAAGAVGRPRQAASPALWALVWYAVLILLGVFWPQPGWSVGLVMIAVFACILRSLLRLSAALDGWGYAVQAAPVKLGAGRLAAAYLLSLVVLAAVFSLASNHLTMEAHPVDRSPDSAETAAIRESMMSLGFPEEWLELLPEAEIEKLSGASGCRVDRDADWGDPEETGVSCGAVQVRIGARIFRCYHFFTADTGRAALQNRLTLAPDSRANVEDMAGQLLWGRNGISYAGDLTWESSARSLLQGESTVYTALFSYPFSASRRQGWCAYTTVFPEDWAYGISTCYYQTQALGDLYPWALLPAQPWNEPLDDRLTQIDAFFPLAF